MTTETVLTEEQRELLYILHMEDFMDGESADRAIKAIERAVLQSPEVQRMRRDAERYQWLSEGGPDQLMIVEDMYEVDLCQDYLDSAIDAAMENKE